MSKSRLRPSRDRGAVLVQVGIALLVLLGFSALVLDYGILWVSRAQAQNAADAGALAGAVSLAFEGNDRSPTGPAVTKAAAGANQNRVWGQPAGVTPQVPDPISFPTCPDGTDTCIRVNVYRNQTHGNVLPVFFARLFGVSQQGVQAMATAQAAYASVASCMKPWAIPDRWEELGPEDPSCSGDATTPNTCVFDLGTDRYDGNEFQRDGITLNSAFTGYKGPAWDSQPGGSDVGMLVRLKEGNPADAPTPGWFQPIDEPDSSLCNNDVGGRCYYYNIAGCNENAVYRPGDDLTVEPGNMIGPTRQGVEDLIASDPGTFWNASQRRVDCNPTLGPCTGLRIGPVAIYDPEAYELARRSGRVEIQTKYLLGFLVEGMDGKDVLGRFVPVNGRATTTPGEQTSWLRIIRLVR